MDRMIVGTGGSVEEKVFDPVYKALSEPNLNGANAGFLRSDAYLALVFITDAEDQSVKIDGQDLYDYLANLKGGRERVLSYGAIVPSNVTNCTRDDGTHPTRIEAFLGLSPSAGFNEFSLCDTKFGNRIAEMGRDLARRSGSVLRLRRVPVIETIRMSFGTQVVPPDPLDGWSYEAETNSLHIGPNLVWSKQPDGTELVVTYTPTKFKSP
jgi:hypothetical protein